MSVPRRYPLVGQFQACSLITVVSPVNLKSQIDYRHGILSTKGGTMKKAALEV
jgi:hypothetical protein